MTCLAPICSAGAKKVYMGVFASVAILAVPLSIIYEYKDASLVNKVTSVFAQCIAQNISFSESCCIPNWSEIVAQEYHLPMLSVVNTVALPILGFGLGVIAHKIIPELCKARGRLEHEYRPVPNVSHTSHQEPLVSDPFKQNIDEGV